MDVKREILELLAEKERRLKGNLIKTLYPDTGKYRRELYPMHMKFFEAGKHYRERAMIAGNRIGKSFGAGGYETALHLTGQYPDWWPGRRFNHPISGWAAGQTAETTRDTIQQFLLGSPKEHGTGLIPMDCLIDVNYRKGTSDAVEAIYVRHVTGGTSRVGLKSFDQGPASFMGTAQHWIWLDEEPPIKVYTEALTRTMVVPGATLAETTTGLLVATFTPLNGLSEVVDMYLHEGKILTEGEHSERFVLQLTWDDVPHLTEEVKKSMLASYPENERDVRSKGIPQLGSGRIYPFSEDAIGIEPFNIPREWPRFYAMDVGYTAPTAVLWFAWDRENDVLYAYSEHYKTNLMPWEHAHWIKQRGEWMSGVIDPASKVGRPSDGVTMWQEYMDQGLNLYPANNAIQAGIVKVTERLKSDRLKIFKNLRYFFEEFRLYRWDKEGRKPYIKQNDHLMDCLRYGVMSGIPVAMTEILAREEASEYIPMTQTGVSRVCGY